MARELSHEEDQAGRQEVTSVLVHPKHIRQADLCMKGARIWFESHGIPWKDVVHGGVPVELLEETGDKMALDVAKCAREDNG